MRRDGNASASGYVDMAERVATVALATSLGALAYSNRPGRARAGFTAASLALAIRGLTGWCPVYAFLRKRQGEDTRTALRGRRGVFVRQGVTIRQSPAALYAFWRDLGNLPRFLRHVRHVEELSATRSRWTVRAPLGQAISWEAEIINDVPGSVIGWQSCTGSQVATAGSVRFREAPGNRGAELIVTLQYAPPAGKLGALVAGLFGESPASTVREDLRRLKQLMETGEVAVATPMARDDLAMDMQTAFGPGVRDDLEPSWSQV